MNNILKSSLVVKGSREVTYEIGNHRMIIFIVFIITTKVSRGLSWRSEVCVCPLSGLIPIFFKNCFVHTSLLFFMLFVCFRVSFDAESFLAVCLKCVENNKEVKCHIIELFTWTTSYFLVSNIFTNLVCFLVLDYIILNDGLYEKIQTIGWRGTNVASRNTLLLTVGLIPLFARQTLFSIATDSVQRPSA